MAEPWWFNVYARLPVWAQHVAFSLANIRVRFERYGRTFRQALRFLEASDRWSLTELRAYQDEQLAGLVRHAYETVPYYRELFDGLNLRPDDVRAVDDLPKLPILDKETVRRRHDDLLCRTWPKRRIRYGRTGGTTGTALSMAFDAATQPWHLGTTWRHRGRFGLRPLDSCVEFAGRSVVPLDTLSPPIWRRDIATHRSYVSVHHLTRQNMAPLVEYLQTRRVEFYLGYPSALYLVATYMDEEGIRLQHPPRITATASETVLPHQRRLIEQALDTELIDRYSQSEHCSGISECEHHTYHVDMEFGVIEFLPLEGGDGSLCRIISTGLCNPVMPLIRYDVADVATVRHGPCPCGRASPTVERIDGRIEGIIVTPDGRRLGRLDFLFKSTDRIKEAQLVQDAPDHLTANVVRRNGYRDEDERNLMKSLRAYLGEAIRIDLAYLPEIPRGPNGKFRQIVSEVSPARP